MQIGWAIELGRTHVPFAGALPLAARREVHARDPARIRSSTLELDYASDKRELDVRVSSSMAACARAAGVVRPDRTMKPCILIPFYNHGGAIAQVVASLQPLGLPCRIVDDGSDARPSRSCASASNAESWVTSQRLPQNQGKGAAVMAGCDAALARRLHARAADRCRRPAQRR